MQSFTGMSDPAIAATVRNMEEDCDRKGTHTYRIEFNRSDFRRLMWSLQCISDGTVADANTMEWAASFASGIAETLGVEMI